MQESNPCFVHYLHPYGKGPNKHKTNNISVVSLEKGLKHGETSHLAALIEIKLDKMVEMPDCIINSSSEFARHETMLLQLLDSEWTFEIHTDTSNKVIGVVLEQEAYMQKHLTRTLSSSSGGGLSAS